MAQAIRAQLAAGCEMILLVSMTAIIDLVLPRLLAGDRLTRRELVRLGHGGLLEEIRERHLLREAVDHL